MIHPAETHLDTVFTVTHPVEIHKIHLDTVYSAESVLCSKYTWTLYLLHNTLSTECVVLFVCKPLSTQNTLYIMSYSSVMTIQSQ
jgi:hypothetical protein